LILFVDPDEESLGIVMEDTSSFWPVSLESCGFEIFVTTLEKEMISNKLLLLGFSHVTKRIVSTLKITSEFTKSGGNKLFDFVSLLSCNGSSEWVVSQVSSNSDSSGVDHLVLVNWEWWAVELSIVHG